MARATGFIICLVTFHIICAIIFLAAGGACRKEDCNLNEFGTGVLLGTGVGMLGSYLFAVPFGILVLTKIVPLF